MEQYLESAFLCSAFVGEHSLWQGKSGGNHIPHIEFLLPKQSQGRFKTSAAGVPIA